MIEDLPLLDTLESVSECPGRRSIAGASAYRFRPMKSKRGFRLLWWTGVVSVADTGSVSSRVD